MSEQQILAILERLVLILVIAPAAFPLLRRFRRQLLVAAIALYAVAVLIALVLTALYFMG